MTFDNDHALARVPREQSSPLLRQVLPVGEARRRSELQELIDLVLPERPGPGDELWMGHGPDRPMSIPDMEMLCALEADGFDGWVWSELENRLAGYGVGVVGAWISTGEIYRRATEKGRPSGRRGWRSLATKRSSSPTKPSAPGSDCSRKRPCRTTAGARTAAHGCLPTFLGSCVLCFANACRKQAEHAPGC